MKKFTCIRCAHTNTDNQDRRNSRLHTIKTKMYDMIVPYLTR